MKSIFDLTEEDIKKIKDEENGNVNDKEKDNSLENPLSLDDKMTLIMDKMNKLRKLKEEKEELTQRLNANQRQQEELENSINGIMKL